MVKFRWLLLLFSMIACASGQQLKQQSKYWKKNINYYLSIYDQVNPFDEYTSLQNLNISEKTIKSLHAQIKDKDAWSTGKDSINTFYLIACLQDSIMSTIDQLLHHNPNSFGDIILSQHLENGLISFVESDDSKLFNVSLDEKTGGTYQSRISRMFYTTIEKNATKSLSQEDTYAVFKSDGFDNIYSLNTPEGTKYVLTGTVRGCSMCFGSSIILVKPENNTFKLDFAYSFSSRNPESTIHYDPDQKTIEVNYETDDLTTSCDCVNQAIFDDMLLEIDETNYACTCVFKFNQTTFETVKAIEKIIKN